MATTYNTPFITKPDPGLRLTDSRAFWDAIVNANAVSTAYGITAAGTTQATATQLTSVINEVDTAAASTGVNLPDSSGSRSSPYQSCIIMNNGENAITVYAAQGKSDTINGVAGATGISLPAGSAMAFFSPQKTKWFAQTGGAVSGQNLPNLGSGTTVLMGSATTSAFPLSGNINTQIFAATAAEPGATGADNVIAAFSIPANAFSSAGRGIVLNAAGGYAGTANTKTVKIIFNPASATVGSTVGAGGTTVATTGALTQSGTGWLLQAAVFKYGAAASNTQYAKQLNSISGAVDAGVGVPAFPTATESGAILVAVTGNAATAVSDINLNMFTVDAFN